MKVYIASGWWSEQQEQARVQMITACKSAEIKVYSPKDDFLYIKGQTDPSEVFEENIKQIDACNFILASTVDKDMGVLFECGYAFSVSKPILYYWPGGKGPFNLMLSQTAKQVCLSESQLKSSLKEAKINGFLKYVEYKGDIE